MTPVRLEPAALRSRVKHSTTEPLVVVVVVVVVAVAVAVVVVVFFCLIDLILYVPSTFSYVGRGLPGLNQY